MGDEGAPFTFEIKHHVVLHAADVDDVADGDLAIFAVDFEEGCRRCGGTGVRGCEICLVGRCILVLPRLRTPAPPIIQTKPFLRLVDGGEELIIADGLQEEVKGLDLITLEGVFLEGGGEDDTCL